MAFLHCSSQLLTSCLKSRKGEEILLFICSLLKFFSFISCLSQLPLFVMTGKGQPLLRPLWVGSSEELLGTEMIIHQWGSILLPPHSEAWVKSSPPCSVVWHLSLYKSFRWERIPSVWVLPGITRMAMIVYLFMWSTLIKSRLIFFCRNALQEGGKFV